MSAAGGLATAANRARSGTVQGRPYVRKLCNADLTTPWHPRDFSPPGCKNKLALAFQLSVKSSPRNQSFPCPDPET